MERADPQSAVSGPPRLKLRYADLPGPKGVPFFGNAFQLDKDRLHQQLEGWAREFGPSFRVRIANRRMLILSDHKVVASVQAICAECGSARPWAQINRRS